MEFKPLPILSPSRRLGIFESACSSDCWAWTDCGGAETAPCRCIHTKPSDRLQCHRCPIICRDRNTEQPPGKPADDFKTHIGTGRSLDQLTLSHPPILPTFPAFIPTRTYELRSATRLPFRWAGVSFKYLLTESQPANLVRHLRSPSKVRESIRVAPQTQLLAVLNGPDSMLEGFWTMRRTDLYAAMNRCGLSYATGPTFSVYYDPSVIPASHNVCMQLRHHQVAHEMQSNEIIVAPNLYWRDYRDRRRWAEWLKLNAKVSVISREFGLAIKEGIFPSEFAGLVEIIEQAERRFHVLLVGVGVRTARAALLHLDRVGCTATIVTGSPILEARIRGCELNYRGAETPEEVKSDLDFPELAMKNLKVMEQFVLDVVTPLASYRNYRQLDNRLHRITGRRPDRPIHR